jgi:hypothetical protein
MAGAVLVVVTSPPSTEKARSSGDERAHTTIASSTETITREETGAGMPHWDAISGVQIVQGSDLCVGIVAQGKAL